MTQQGQVYKCQICGMVVEVLDGGAGEPICCGRSMEQQEPKTADPATEKHVPVIEQVDGGILVKVGSVPHPMEDKHFIQWIEVLVDGKAYREYLQPGAPAEARFPVQGENIIAREFCNLHGLWQG